VKYEYKDAKKCRNNASRIILSMTTKEAENISNDLREFLRNTGYISHASEKFFKSVCEAVDLHESKLIPQDNIQK